MTLGHTNAAVKCKMDFRNHKCVVDRREEKKKNRFSVEKPTNRIDYHCENTF